LKAEEGCKLAIEVKRLGAVDKATAAVKSGDVTSQ
jgi:hypothetical protein